MDDNIDTLIALELIRRAIADLPMSLARNAGREPESAYQPRPINPSNPAVVMTPGGPSVDPSKVLAPKGPPPVPGSPDARKKSVDDLAKMQQDAARDLKAAGKASKEGAGAGKGGGGVLGALGSAASAVTAAFGKMLSPMSLLQGMLGSTTSGFGLITRTMNLLYAILAPILLPVLFLFAAGLLYVSDLLMKYLWPAIKKLWEVIGPTLIKAFEVLASAVESLAEFIRKVTGERTAKDFEQEVKRQDKRETDLAKLGAGFGAFTRGEDVGKAQAEAEKSVEERQRRRTGIAGQLAEAAGVKVQRPTGLTPAAEKAFEDLFNQGAQKLGLGKVDLPGRHQRDEPKEPSFKAAMKDMLAVFQLQMGPKASFGQLGASQTEAAILAAFQDPIEQRMLKAQEFAVKLLQDLVANTEPDKGSHQAK